MAGFIARASEETVAAGKAHSFETVTQALRK
jgi:hypothetical protein